MYLFCCSHVYEGWLVYMCASYVCLLIYKSEKRVRSAETEVPLCGSWELSPCPLQQQQVLLTSEPALLLQIVSIVLKFYLILFNALIEKTFCFKFPVSKSWVSRELIYIYIICAKYLFNYTITSSYCKMFPVLSLATVIQFL